MKCNITITCDWSTLELLRLVRIQHNKYLSLAAMHLDKTTKYRKAAYITCINLHHSAATKEQLSADTVALQFLKAFTWANY